MRRFLPQDVMLARYVSFVTILLIRGICYRQTLYWLSLYILSSISNFVFQCCNMLVMLVEARIVNFCTQASYQVYQKTHVLFVRQTGSSLPILEVCGFCFRQFSGSGDHFSTDHRQMPCTNKIQQYRLCIQWWM